MGCNMCKEGGKVCYVCLALLIVLSSFLLLPRAAITLLHGLNRQAIKEFIACYCMNSRFLSQALFHIDLSSQLGNISRFL